MPSIPTSCEGRECWPQAEAVVGYSNAFQPRGEPKYVIAADRVWDYVERNLIDRVPGEWFWRINQGGKLDGKLPKNSEWKGPEHVKNLLGNHAPVECRGRIHIQTKRIT
jgi:mannose/cellobiose epimerase-like protein (N-acyl-D-glucosamine 2-epimerase family)